MFKSRNIYLTYSYILSGDEEEEDAIVNQVLDEIGIEISGKVRNLQYLPIDLLFVLGTFCSICNFPSQPESSPVDFVKV